MAQDLHTIISQLANRDAPRTEAVVQAGIRDLLIAAPLNLDDEDVRLIQLESGHQPAEAIPAVPRVPRPI